MASPKREVVESRSLHSATELYPQADDSCGLQRCSLRPTSARYSFPRSGRSCEVNLKDTPGPGDYDVVDYTSALNSAAAVLGTSPRWDPRLEASRYGADEEADVHQDYVPDAAELRFPAPARPVFGTEPRTAEIRDLDLLKACPDYGYNRTSPGLIYTPNDRMFQSRRTPSWTIGSRVPLVEGLSTLRASTVGPASYRSEVAIGVQVSSRRRTSRASSFGRAPRFSAPKKAEGNLSAECKSEQPGFGRCEAGRKWRRPQSAGFGRATRDACARACQAMPVGDRPPSAQLGPPRLPHPEVAPRQEILKFTPVSRKY